MNPLVELIEAGLSGRYVVDDGRLRKLMEVESRAIAVAAASTVLRVTDPELLCQVAVRQLLSLASPLERSDDDPQAVVTIRNAIESLLRSLPRQYLHVAISQVALTLAADLREVPYDPLEGHVAAADLRSTLLSIETIADHHHQRYLARHPDSSAGAASVSEQILQVIKGHDKGL